MTDWDKTILTTKEIALFITKLNLILDKDGYITRDEFLRMVEDAIRNIDSTDAGRNNVFDSKTVYDW